MNLFPIDQEARNDFSVGVNHNYSLVCPAGSGKTYGISKRVLTLATQPDAVELLPRLVVVTFTNASADEMHSRARETLLAARVPWEVQRAFDFAFFGTIHSFANRLLRNYGHHVGLPPVFEVCSEADSVWGRFVRKISAKSLVEGNAVLRHYPIQDVLNLVKQWDPMRKPDSKEKTDKPNLDFSDIYNFELPKRKDTAANIEAFQRQLRLFEQVFNEEDGVDFCRLPVPKKGGKAFVSLAEATLAPVQKWVNQMICRLAFGLAQEFRAFRIREGVLLFDDIIYLARELLQHDQGKVDVRANDYILLLDEAQDTDPYQFDFLIESVRPVMAKGLWREDSSLPPEGGKFSMVGDLQQSIHSKRADLSVYREAISYIGNSANGGHLNFEVTFRCDGSVVDNAEGFFSRILNGQDGQVPYVPIKARTDAAEGNTMRLEISTTGDEESIEEVCMKEAEQIGAALIAMRERGQLSRWNEVALICPRKKWFGALSRGLSKVGITSQFLSYGTTHRDSLAWSWVTAMARCFTCPSDTYETVGVLRDVYGHSDLELFDYSKGQGDRFILNGKRSGPNAVVSTMNRLSTIRKACIRNSLLDAVEVIIEEIRPRVGTDRNELMMLDRISCLAAKDEKAGVDLESFAKSLISELSAPLETSGENPNDSVQIITDLKAKGLQWEVVVLPYFFRGIASPNEQYPKMVGHRLDYAQVASSKADITDAEQQRAEIAAIQEMERRLYVSFTRPKHVLIICDDEEAFTPFKKDFLPNYGKVLRVTEEGQLRAQWEALPAFDADQIEMKADSIAGSTPSPEVITIDLDQSRDLAFSTLERVRPYRAASSFSHEEREFNQDDVTFINGASGRPSAISYGVWWHETMKHAPWAKPERLEEAFTESLLRCPERQRGELEIQMLLDSELMKLIMSRDLLIKSEMPFQYRSANGHSVEGIMDLCLVDVLDGKWHVIDWKTNRSTSLDALVEQYEGQIRAYSDAIERLAQPTSIRAGIYSTALGVHSFSVSRS